jgi:hypothetical protein
VNVFVTYRKRVELCALWFPSEQLASSPKEIKLSDDYSTKWAISCNKAYHYITNCMQAIPLRSDFVILLLPEEKEET